MDGQIATVAEDSCGILGRRAADGAAIAGQGCRAHSMVLLSVQRGGSSAACASLP